MTDLEQNKKALVVWIASVCTLIFIMVVVGGVTRLTHSGLSMVDWQPIMGVIPPIGEVEWQDTFNKYKQFPEYQKLNQHMDLAGFKEIFYWEYGHRVLGRLIGVVFIVPFIFFWLAGRIEKTLKPKLVVALILGGLQGLMGWYMVMSGLVDIPRVSHYRLAAHLMLALVIFAWLFWIILGLLNSSGTKTVGKPGWSRPVSYFLLGLVIVQIIYGAFVAGLRSGFGYNTFPLMNGQFIADAAFMLNPWWLNLFENGAAVQFIHRWIGILLLCVTSAVWIAAIRGDYGRRFTRSSNILFITMVSQVLIGILTLTFIIPLWLATFHQALACILLLAVVNFVFVARGPSPVN